MLFVNSFIKNMVSLKFLFIPNIYRHMYVCIYVILYISVYMCVDVYIAKLFAIINHFE